MRKFALLLSLFFVPAALALNPLPPRAACEHFAGQKPEKDRSVQGLVDHAPGAATARVEGALVQASRLDQPQLAVLTSVENDVGEEVVGARRRQPLIVAVGGRHGAFSHERRTHERPPVLLLVGSVEQLGLTQLRPD